MLGLRQQAAPYPQTSPMISRHNPAHLSHVLRATSQVSAEIIIEMPNGQGRRVELAQPAVIIGRSQTATVTLDAPVISRQHARIDRIGDEFWLTDMSSNGTLLNGSRISSARIQNGDLITLGHNSAYPINIVFRASVLTTGSRERWLN